MSEQNEIDIARMRWATLADESRRESQRFLQLGESYQRSAQGLMALRARNATIEEALQLLEEGAQERQSAPGVPKLSPLVPPTSGGVYAIQAGKFIKIGKSKNIAKRMAALQTSHHQRLRLVALLSEHETDERRLHERFAALRSHAEWFHFRGELLKAIYVNRGLW